MKVKPGLEIFTKNSHPFINEKIGLLVHPASSTSTLVHAVDIFKKIFNDRLIFLLAPQHGLYGETQDNMIEWYDFLEPHFNLPVISLYGHTRIPQKDVLHLIDTLVIDLQDVGTRYYTFIWTMALCLKACAKHRVNVVILDRPNPLGGEIVEGNIPSKQFFSFVGLYPLPPRYGLTLGELAQYINEEFKINAPLKVVWMEGWKRHMNYNTTCLPWIAPSPNMPKFETALVYPGMCLLEGTNISEGRGTTLPFELFGSPFVHPWTLVEELNQYRLPGVIFRPCYFQPTFHKFQGQLCGGAQLHITNKEKFKSYLTGIAILRTLKKLYPREFKWKLPPYEYEYKKLPIDILCGTDLIRLQIDMLEPLEKIEEKWVPGLNKFMQKRRKYLHY